MRLLSPQLNNTPLLWLDSKQVENPMPVTEPSVLHIWSLFIPHNSMIMTAPILKRRKLKLGQVNTIIQDCSDGAGLHAQLQLRGCKPNHMLYDYIETSTRIKLVEPKNESTCNWPSRVRHHKIIDSIIKEDTIRSKQWLQGEWLTTTLIIVVNNLSCLWVKIRILAIFPRLKKQQVQNVTCFVSPKAQSR